MLKIMVIPEERARNNKLLKEIIISEVIIISIIYVIIMVTTYVSEGVQGVDKLVNSLNDQFSLTAIIATIINFIIGVILWIFYRYFNFAFKSTLMWVSEGLLDTFTSLFRLSGGILIAFTLIYLIEVGYEHILLVFLIYGLISVYNSSFLVFFKRKMYQKPDRPIKRTSY
ncbi:Uncharacterised protein [Acinetobacter baumannii]|nr:hypothetical protein AB901B6_00126 [Acinetobacter baumannii]SSS77841.1 Uncharacterised protein [Acinetobacter baumannii]